LEVIEEREPTVQVSVALKAENARKAADQSSARYKSGNPILAIDGMQVGIKDVLQSNDNLTTPGSLIFKDHHVGID
jgi:Asp-tRNA(Asn)/Glu-tRNA(Gln) amidotransferase A subunit family amidase